MRAASKSKPPLSYALFSTATGTSPIAWSSRGIAWIELPGHTPQSILARMTAALGEPVEAEPPPHVKDAIERITRYLDGCDVDLSTITLDMDAIPPFFRRVYQTTRALGRGEVRTYSEIAAAAGSPAAVRAVGQALAKNPFPPVVPCHRVVASDGKPGGFSAPGGLDTKARLLAHEGASLILRGPRLKTRPAAS